MATSPFRLNVDVVMSASIKIVPSGNTSAPSTDLVLNASACLNSDNLLDAITRHSICITSKLCANTTVTILEEPMTKNLESGETLMECGRASCKCMEEANISPVEEENVIICVE